MTEMVYYEHPYQKKLKVKVVRVDGKRVLLDKTIFFPQTSTEPGDLGKIDGFKIAGLKKDGQDIWHILQRTVDFGVGDMVELELDWNRRYTAMKLHSALHLLGSVFDNKFKQRAVAGVVQPKFAYLVFKQGLSDEVVDQALKEANRVIRSNVKIKTYWDDEREGFRWSRVGDYQPIPCGGLHVENSSEIGSIKILKKELKTGRLKLSIGLGT